MSWHFLQEQGEGSWEGTSLDGAPSALLKSIPSAVVSYSRANATECSSPSPSGMTSKPSTGDPGEGRSTSSPAASLASPSLPQAAGERSQPTDGPPCSESSERSSPSTSSERTSLESPSSKPPPSYAPSDTYVEPPEFPPPAWVPRIGVNDSGWLPTPTATANPDCDYMQRWPSHRRLREAFGRRSLGPTLWEWMMGWPIGWTALKPLETGRFQAWLRAHGKR